MANQKILEKKQVVIDEIANHAKESNAFILFEYQGLTVADMTELRRKLRESDSDLKIYKNTLTKRALDSLNIDLGDELNGPKAVAFGPDMIAPIKALNEFAKTHEALQLKIGIVDGEVTDLDTLKKLAAIPSREGLLTMFASGLLQYQKEFAIGVDLYRQKLEEENK